MQRVITLSAMHFPYPVAHEIPLFLAPMSGVSESPFRLLCRRFGADVVVSEFISAVGVARGIEHLLEDMRFEDAERPIGIQLYGADATVMARAAAMVTEVCEPDFIDINFGCPVKKVVKNNVGSGCLKDLGLVQAIIRAVRNATQLPVTVKIRSGWDEAQRDPVGIALRCREAGAQALTLHARTRTQMFSGQANWDEIARVVEALDVPVIGNGDVSTPEDILAMRRHTGCAGVMVARGAFGNPWLFAQGRDLLAGRPSGRPRLTRSASRPPSSTRGSPCGCRATRARRRSSSASTSAGTRRACRAPRACASSSFRSSRCIRPKRSSPPIWQRRR